VDSLGVVIEKPVLELLDIDRETELDMRTDGERLIIEPIRGARLATCGGAAGIRDTGLLESAVAMPRATAGGAYVHEGLFAMAAA